MSTETAEKVIVNPVTKEEMIELLKTDLLAWFTVSDVHTAADLQALRDQLSSSTLLIDMQCEKILKLQAENAALQAKVTRSSRIIRDISDTFYGQNLALVGWHLNGDPQPMDTFFDDNDWSEVSS